MVPDRVVRGEKKCALCSKMVLTTASPPSSTLQGMFGSPPKRGATLPKYSTAASACSASEAARRTTRANTLPGHVATMNNNNRMADFPITSRNAPAHISINSLPISDNEALNFDNRSAAALHLHAGGGINQSLRGQKVQKN